MKSIVSYLCSILSVCLIFNCMSQSNLVYADGLSWDLVSVDSDKPSPQKIGTPIKISARVSGNTQGLLYSVSFRRNNDEYDVIKPFSPEPSCTWTPSKAGKYQIYVSVKDSQRNVRHKTFFIDIKTGIWGFESITFNKTSPQKVNEQITIKCNTSGDTGGLLYKFSVTNVSRSNYSVLQPYSHSNTVTWRPSEPGEYKVLVDIRDSEHINIFKVARFTINSDVSPARGIDVSVWQDDIDWRRVKDSGVKFAMVRCGFGKDEPGQTDRKFHDNVRGAQSVGLDVGVYHFSYAASVQEAVQEAEFCLSLIKGYKLTYPIAFDIESSKYTEPHDKRTLTDICKAFCNTIERAGYYAIIYMCYNWATTRVYTQELFPRYDLWLAQWQVSSPGRECGMWQFTNEGSAGGIKGNVDCDIAYRNYPEIMRNRHLNGF